MHSKKRMIQKKLIVRFFIMENNLDVLFSFIQNL